ncbi:hypothetical protein GCM10010372_83090 [Streptomyces tauricus]|uniref:RHS repeat-associated core domain-containing protein n=1 Tax=Streptomyces tauricus TaxID=68274 RepID=UPI0019C44DD4|nr:hypothetical protein GCM10010372_83090 [Streptomyces tauricus]
MYRLGARYYDTNIGRFTQPDPSSQEKNPYLYAEGDPVNRIDPNGLYSWSIGGEICFGLCIGGGYAENDNGSEGGGFFRVGLGSPGGGVSVGLNNAEIGKGNDGWGYANCSAVVPEAEVNLGKSGFSGGGGSGLNFPGCNWRSRPVLVDKSGWGSRVLGTPSLPAERCAPWRDGKHLIHF